MRFFLYLIKDASHYKDYKMVNKFENYTRFEVLNLIETLVNNGETSIDENDSEIIIEFLPDNLSNYYASLSKIDKDDLDAKRSTLIIYDDGVEVYRDPGATALYHNICKKVVF